MDCTVVNFELLCQDAAATGAVVAGASAAIAKGEARTDEKIAAQRGRRVRGDMG